MNQIFERQIIGRIGWRHLLAVAALLGLAMSGCNDDAQTITVRESGLDVEGGDPSETKPPRPLGEFTGCPITDLTLGALLGREVTGGNAPVPVDNSDPEAIVECTYSGSPEAEPVLVAVSVFRANTERLDNMRELASASTVIPSMGSESILWERESQEWFAGVATDSHWIQVIAAGHGITAQVTIAILEDVAASVTSG